MPYQYKPLKPRVAEPTFMEKVSDIGDYRLGGEEDQVPSPGPQTGEGMIPDIYQHGLTTILRVAGPWLGATAGAALGSGAAGVGAVPGGVAGGAAGGAISELLAEKVEPGGLDRPVNRGRVAVNTALGALPGSATVRSGRPLASIAAGTGIGYGAVAGDKFLAQGKTVKESVNPAEWSGAELALGPGLGGAVSGVMGAVTPKPPAGAPKPPPPPSYKGREGLRIALDELRAVPKDDVKVTPEILAKHKALVAEQARNPTGPISAELGPPLTVRKRNADGSVVWAPPSIPDVEKLHDEANTLLTKQATVAERDLTKEGLQMTRNEKARRKFIMDNLTQDTRNERALNTYKQKEATQESRNLGARDKFIAQDNAQQAKNLNHRDKYLQAKADEDAAQAKIDSFLSNPDVEAGPTTVTESAKAKVDGGNQTLKQTFRIKPPEVDGEGEAAAALGGAPSIIPSSTPKLPRKTLEQTGFSRKEEAMAAALKEAGIDVRSLGRGKHHVIYPDAPKAPTAAPLAPLGPPGPAASKFNSKVDDILGSVGSNPELPVTPPTEAPAPLDIPEVVAPKPTRVTPSGDVELERMKVQGRRMSKNEATTLARHLGGEAHQDSPRKWSVRFPKAEAQDVAEPIVPVESPVAVPVQPKVAPTPYVPEPAGPPPISKGGMFDRGALTPEEFKRFNQLRPVLNGPKQTAAESAEFASLQAKKDGTPLPAPKVEEPPMTVEEFAGALSKEGDKPIAEVPYSLGREAAKVTSKQASLADAPDPAFEAMLDRSAGEPGGVPKPMNPQGQGTMSKEPQVKAKKPKVEPKPVEQRVADAKAKYTPEMNAELDAAGEAYRAATDPVEKRRLGGVLSGLAKKAKAALVSEASGHGLGPTSEELLSMSPKEQEAALKSIADKFKSEKGEVDAAFLAKLGMSLGGALIGSAMNPEDPALGAVGGAAIGYGGTAAALRVGAGLRSGQDIKDAMEPIIARIPNYMRGGMLSHPLSIAYNSVAGPWGSTFLGSIEETFKGIVNGDAAQRDSGLGALTAAISGKWFRRLPHSLQDAKEKLHDVEEMGRAGQFIQPENPNLLDRMAEIPAAYMLTGDLNSKAILSEEGIAEKTIKKMTLTDEPDRALWKAMVNWAKTKSGSNDDGQTSTIAKIIAPFVRTAANIMQSGTERTPGLGSVINYMGDKSLRIPAAEQAVQQVMGAGVWTMGYAAGLGVDEDTVKRYKMLSLVSNLGGQYSLLAGTGFLAGQARRAGKSFPDAAASAASRSFLGEGMPLPTTQPLKEMATPILKAAAGDTPPLKDWIPALAKPKILNFGEEVRDALGQAPGPASPARGMRPPRQGGPGYRYKPIKPRVRSQG